MKRETSQFATTIEYGLIVIFAFCIGAATYYSFTDRAHLERGPYHPTIELGEPPPGGDPIPNVLPPDLDTLPPAQQPPHDRPAR